MTTSGSMETIRTKEDIIRLNGQRAVVIGRYCAVERPMRGIVRQTRPRDHALLQMQDGERVYLEPFESPSSRRPSNELSQFDGKRVRVTGIAYKFMPASGESPLAPCVAEITDVREDDLSESNDR
jgi:hypothetical protein